MTLGCCTVGQNNQKSRLQYWATRSYIRSFARTAHSFTCSGLLASLAPSAALTRSLARSLLRLWDSELLMSQNDLVLSHSASVGQQASRPQARRRSSRAWRWSRFPIHLYQQGDTQTISLDREQIQPAWSRG